MERRTLYGGVVTLVGVVLAVVQVIHALQQSTLPVVVAVDAVPMVGVALAFAFAGTHLAREGAYEADLERVLGWTVGGTIVFVSFAALTLFSQNVATGDLARAEFVAVDNLTVGATAGMLVGLYDARSRQGRRALEAERDRVQAFAGKAADLNNYGRAIVQAEDVSGVSAFAIQAVSTLLGFGETAVLAADGDVEVYGSTVVGLDDAGLETLADVARDQAQGRVVVHDDPPAGLSRDVDTTLTVNVADRDHATVVMVTIADEDHPVEEEDRELLELLGSHVAMAIESIDHRSRAD